MRESSQEVLVYARAGDTLVEWRFRPLVRSSIKHLIHTVLTAALAGERH